MKSLLLLVTAMILGGDPVADLSQQIKSMDNSSVHWHMTYVGVLPMIDADLLKNCREHQKAKWFRNQLVEKLKDKKSFVAAQVLLVYSTQGKWDGKSHSGWFGLEFDVNDAGDVVFRSEEEQAERLTKLWTERLKASDTKK